MKNLTIHVDIKKIENGEYFTHVFKTDAPRDGFKAISKNREAASQKAWEFAFELAQGRIADMIFC